jgi:GAF domain-containing protein
MSAIPAAALDRLEGHRGSSSLLRATCQELVAAVDASGCVLSRLVGETLVELAEHSVAGRFLQLGHGYLLSDYPLTREAIERAEPRLVSLFDESPDPMEAALLEELRFDALLMIPIVSAGRAWGLVEIYNDRGCAFAPDDIAPVQPIVARLGELLTEL